MDKIRAVAESAVLRAARTRLSMSSRMPFWRADDAQRDREGGQGLAEYSLILGGIAVVAIVSLAFLGGTITDLFWDPIDEQFSDVLCNVIGICPAPPPPA